MEHVTRTVRDEMNVKCRFHNLTLPGAGEMTALK